MKQKFFLVFLSCLICISLFSISAFADDSSEIYSYSFTPTLPYSASTIMSSLPYTFVCAKDSVSTLDNSVVLHTGDSVEVKGANYNNSSTVAKLSVSINGGSSQIIELALDVPFYYYSSAPTLTAFNMSSTLTGTLYVEPVETTSPSAFGGSVSDGVSSSVGFAGQVLDFIVDSPILICVGVAVGVFLVGWGISKVKDLVKGY